MKQFGIILKFELANFFKNKVFVGITVALMVINAVVMAFPTFKAMIKPGDSPENPENPDEPSNQKIMYVITANDMIGDMIKEPFKSVFKDYDVQFSKESEENVKNKIKSGEIECAFVINDFTKYKYYVNTLNIYDMNAATAGEVLKEIYKTMAMIQGGLSPEQVQEISKIQVMGETENLGKDQAKNIGYTYVMILALYMCILMYGSMVASSVAAEKSTRAMEVLITSANPVSMMFGKVISACVAGLTQLICIFGSAMLFYSLNAEAWGNNEIIKSFFDIPLDMLVYMIVFFLLGFLIYAFLFGAVASTVSKLEDMNTATIPIVILFVIGFIVVMGGIGSGNVDSLVMKIFSYVPFTSSMAMFTRIALGSVATYEIIISIGLLIGFTIGTGFFAAKVYRVGVLLYGNKPGIKNIIKALKDK